LFNTTAPQDVRLIQRLRQVCQQEGLQVSNSAFIAELCAATGYDIRASLNNLQFAALKTVHARDQQLQQLQQGASGGASASKKSLDIGAVLHSMIKSGLKDDNLDLSHIWKGMFTLQNPSSSTSSNQGNQRNVFSCFYC
jgi:DNA polymerase III delta prime subunit